MNCWPSPRGARRDGPDVVAGEAREDAAARARDWHRRRLLVVWPREADRGPGAVLDLLRLAVSPRRPQGQEGAVRITRAEVAALGRKREQPVKGTVTPAIDLSVYPIRVARDRIVAQCSIPGEPAAKQRPRWSKKSRSFYTPPETQAREETIGLLVRSQMRDLFVDALYAYGLRVAFYVQDGKKKDVDNMLKLVSDAVNGIVWKDDSQVHEVMGWRREDAVAPRTEILIYRLNMAALREARRCLVCERPLPPESPRALRPRAYCSIRCSALAQRNRKVLQCANCNKILEKKPFDAERSRSGRVFCDRDCWSNFSRVKTVCGRCGSALVRPRSMVPTGNAFCSSACYHASRTERLRSLRSVSDVAAGLGVG